MRVGPIAKVPPYSFGSLNRDELQAESSCLQKCETLWECLCGAEEVATEVPSVAGLLRQMCWLEQPWPREVLVALSEADWKSVPPVIASELLSAARSFKTSKPVEDTFNFLRANERVQSANKLGRTARYHGC